jgi:hypothetical protein
VPVAVSDVGTVARHRCVKQWVAVTCAGMLTTVAGIRVLPLGWTLRHYVRGGIEKCRALEGEGAEALFFWHKVRGTAAAVAIYCALRVTSTYISVIDSFCTVRPVNKSYLHVRRCLYEYSNFDLNFGKRSSLFPWKRFTLLHEGRLLFASVA